MIGTRSALGRVAGVVPNVRPLRCLRSARTGVQETAIHGPKNVLGKVAKIVFHARPSKSLRSARAGVKATAMNGVQNVHGKAASNVAHVQKIAGSGGVGVLLPSVGMMMAL